MTTKLEKFVIPGCRTKALTIDARWPTGVKKLPAIIFCHGYKGYKDWGAWNLVADYFCEQGFVFVKFNFSHNGGTVENPIDFPDLDAFAKNNYSTELMDLHLMIDFVFSSKSLPDIAGLHVLGHSRGGGIALLGGAQDDRIQSIATWAAVSDFKSRFPSGKALTLWRERGVYSVRNGRTHQDMPHYFQFYEDYHKNEDRLHIEQWMRKMQTPLLIVHGTDDEAVSVDEAHQLAHWASKADLQLIPHAGHTFGTHHPWEKEKLPDAMMSAAMLSSEFFRQF